jgi:hypothetical protein
LDNSNVILNCDGKISKIIRTNKTIGKKLIVNNDMYYATDTLQSRRIFTYDGNNIISVEDFQAPDFTYYSDKYTLTYSDVNNTTTEVMKYYATKNPDAPTSPDQNITKLISKKTLKHDSSGIIEEREIYPTSPNSYQLIKNAYIEVVK